MSYLRVSFLASFLLFLAVVHAQNYYLNEYDSFPNVRSGRDVSDFILQRSNGQHLRYRRDDDSARQRRQGGHGGHEGVTGPVHTFVKTDEHAHFKWGVRHHVGHEYAGHR